MSSMASSKARRLRELLDRQTLVLPGAYNALTAMQIERAGFHALYVSGAALSAARGLPDIGLLSLTEVWADAATIAHAVTIPTIVDVDTGFGPPLVVMRAVKEFERAGLAGMQIEDQDLPKKCGHLPGKHLVSTSDMVNKIRAASEARGDQDLFIIARTDARAVEGLDAAVRRAKAYIDAGADAIFPEALESADEFRAFARRLIKEGGKARLVANMTEFGKTPYISVSEFEDLGYRLVLFPVTALRMATKAIDQMLSELKSRGSQRNLLEHMYTRQQLYDLLGYEKYEQRDRQFHSTDDDHATVETPKTQLYSPGLDGVLAGETALCHVDEGNGGLRYCGYAVSDLADKATFEEVAYLLLHGNLPNHKELSDFTKQVAAQSSLPGPVETFLGIVPAGAHPMDILRTSVSLLGMTDADAGENSHEANLRKSIRLLAQIPLIIARVHRAAQRKPHVQSRPELSFVENLLYMLTGRSGEETAKAMARVLDRSLTLYAEHEFNASTFSARVTASTMTDLHSAITSAIGTLKGPLHGGANEAVAEMFLDIKTPERAEPWVREALANKRRIMGFGHRVLKKGDARSAIIQQQAESLSRTCGDHRWFQIATIVDRVMQQAKGLYPNLDFYTAVAYLLMGIPRELYTPVFVCSRITGWCAHVIEQHDHNRLIRPRALYTGPKTREYVPLDRRR